MELVKALDIQSEYPFDHEFIKTSHGQMHFVDEGQGEPVLALHGNPSWSFLYRKVIKGLSDDYRVIAPDLIGFGLSEKPKDVDSYSLENHIQDIENLVLALDLKNIHLVIHDWGGPIGLAMAARHPERIKSLIILNSFGFYPPNPAMDENNIRLPFALALLRMPLIGHIMVRQFGLFEKRVMPMVSHQKDQFADIHHAYKKVFSGAQDRAGILAFPKLLPTTLEHPSAQIMRNQVEPFLEQFGGKTLLIWGTQDPFMDESVLGAWQIRMPQATTIKIPKASHFLQEDAPEIIVPEIRSFLEKLSHHNH